MDKKVLIISSSPRKGRTPNAGGKAFAKGAREAGNQVETVYLREKQVELLQGLSCLHEVRALRHPRRCRGNCRQNARCKCAGVRNACLLLLRQRSAQDDAGPCQPAVRYGLRLYESLSALQRRQRTHRKPLWAQRRPCRAG